MRSLMTRLVVEPTRSSLIHDWLSSELEQCGFDGNYTSRCVFNIVDRQVQSGPRIGSCPTMSLWAWDEADCAPRPSSAAMSEVGRSGRRSWNGSSDEELKREAIIDLLRLMVSTEVCLHFSSFPELAWIGSCTFTHSCIFSAVRIFEI